ncbi:MAG: bifunctional riboflavin kinase/FAD synthetase [Bacillota bacterium]|nr:bifunctional riboflavin kinase/FAD synthetase [Bacillota bacterium]
MIVYHFLKDIDVSDDCAVSIGTFDGIHLGHTAVLRVMIEKAEELGLKTFVYTFKNNPAAYFSGKNPLIMDENEKISVLESLGVDYVALLPFDEEQVSMTAESFVEDVLCKKMHARFVSVGHDFRFGQGASSTADDLRRYGVRFGFEVHVMSPVLHRGKRISSTDIRELLIRGDMQEVRELLGRDYFVEDTVSSGSAIGRRMGIPTINFVGHPELALKKGVYFTISDIGGKSYRSVTNVGMKPTVTDRNELVIETHLLEFDEELYGEKVKVRFLKWHRDEKKFDSIVALSNQIAEDIKTAKEFFNKITE